MAFEEEYKVPVFDLSGKVVIVTGGTKGLGHGIAYKFAASGAKVVITSRHQDDCDAVAAEIVKLGGDAAGIATDVQDISQIEALVQKTVEKYGRLNIMVNNAGIAVTKKMLDIRGEDYDTVMNTNLKSVYFGTQAAARQMIRQGAGGKIINMCSMCGFKGNNGLSVYGSSKAGAINLTKSFAWELARYGITVNAICPGYVKTAMNRELLENPDFKVKKLKTIPQRRYGTTCEVANLALFLASDLCCMVNGEAIIADMGATLGGDV